MKTIKFLALAFIVIFSVSMAQAQTPAKPQKPVHAGKVEKKPAKPDKKTDTTATKKSHKKVIKNK